MKLDERRVDDDREEIRCFFAVKNESMRLPYLFDYYRKLGVRRFFVVDNDSADGSREFVLEQPDAHCFHTPASYFQSLYQTNWMNGIVNVFGDGHWCLVVDADELLVYPDSESVDLPELCRYLDETGAQALFAPMLDMYGAGPVVDIDYRAGEPFLSACRYFDATPFTTRSVAGACPPIQLFGGVRQRVFWFGEHRRHLPPSLNKVPLVRWRRGARFLNCTHFVTPLALSELQGALLHFKFLPGVAERSEAQRKIGGNPEWSAYAEAFARDPKLSLMGEESVRYRDTAQLVDLGFMKTSLRYRDYIRLPQHPSKEPR